MHSPETIFQTYRTLRSARFHHTGSITTELADFDSVSQPVLSHYQGSDQKVRGDGHHWTAIIRHVKI